MCAALTASSQHLTSPHSRGDEGAFYRFLKAASRPDTIIAGVARSETTLVRATSDGTEGRTADAGAFVLAVGRVGE